MGHHLVRNLRDSDVNGIFYWMILDVEANMLQYHTIHIYIYRYIYLLYLIYLCNILKRYLFDFIGECRYHNCCCFSYHLFIQVYKHIYICIFYSHMHMWDRRTFAISSLRYSFSQLSLRSDTSSLSCLFSQLLLSATSCLSYLLAHNTAEIPNS